MREQHLQVRRWKRVEYELSPEELPCPDCGYTRTKIGEEVSEQLEYVPSSLFVKKQTWCLRC